MIRFPMVIPAVGFILIAILVGCRTASPPVNFYVLQSLEQEQSAISVTDDRNVSTIGVQQVELPGYLNRVEMVRRSGDHQLKIEAQHRWADFLDRMVQQTIRKNLQELMPHTRVIRAPWPIGITPDVTVNYQFQELVGGPDQTISMKVMWTVNDQNGENPTQLGRLNIEAPINGTNFDALADAHSRVLEMLCRKTIETFIAQPAP